MTTQDKALALSTVEVEMLRDLRSRLNRQAISVAAAATLGGVVYKALSTRFDLDPNAEPIALTPAEVVAAAADADLATLSRIARGLEDYRAGAPTRWPHAVAAGAPQSIVTRRLVLAGREHGKTE
jgi:hypothetical protein